jgi:hypothetical protein
MHGADAFLDDPLMMTRFWLFGLVTGAAVAALVTLIMCVWEWLENPGGIFRDASGTQWHFVYDTAVSWFLPVFGWVAILAALCHLVVTRLRGYWKMRQARSDESD